MEGGVSSKSRETIFALVVNSFCLSFIFFVLKALKDTLLVTAPQAGAEAIPFVKMWCLFPVTILFLAGYTWVSTHYSLRKAVMGMIGILLSFYALFTFVLFPMGESLHLHSFADQLQQILPEGWKGLTAVVRYWSYSLFYVVAECWGVLVYSVVFWGYANVVMRFSDAKQYYPYLTLAGTVAALIAGPLTIFLTGEWYASWFGLAVTRWGLALNSLTWIVLALGSIALWAFWRYCPEVHDEGAKEGKPPLRRSIAAIFRSKYLMTLALLSLTFNLVIYLADVVWKDEVGKHYPDPVAFTSYLSYVTLVTGLISTALTLFATRQLLQRFGWTKTALITPSIALITGAAFFVAIVCREEGVLHFAVGVIPFLGSLHVCLTCGGRYTLYEPTKEMAYIPLSKTEKLHGKAMIDGVFSRIGKVGSAVFYQLLLIVFPTVTACTPVVGTFFLLMIALYVGCVLSLGRSLDQQEVVST